MGKEPSNMREWRDKSEQKNLWLVVLCLVFIGGGLTGLIYGPGSLFTVVPCLMLGGGAILLPYLMLVGIEKWVKRRD